MPVIAHVFGLDRASTPREISAEMNENIKKSDERTMIEQIRCWVSYSEEYMSRT